MLIDNPKATARQAADIFAETAFEEIRKVDCKTWKSMTTDGGSGGMAAVFRLVDGRQIYEVWPAQGRCGWEIIARLSR